MYYWIHEWAKVRQDEVVLLPGDFEVHQCFLTQISKVDFDFAFREIWNKFISIYGNIAQSPDTFGMPLYPMKEYNEFTFQARESRSAPYRPFTLLYYLLTSGHLRNGVLVVDPNDFKAVNDVKKIPILFQRLSDHGFFFEGLKNYKVTMQNMIVSYPDNSNVLTVLKLMADKARITERLNDFLCCHYKLFRDDMNSVNYGQGPDIVADKMHTQTEWKFIYAMDAKLREMGYFAQSRGWNEGPGYAYYAKESDMKTKGPYHYWLLSWKTKLVLFLRIRNASKCLAFLQQCPDSVKQIFLWSDPGCANRNNGKCLHGQEYTIEGNTYRRCGCCNAPFHFNPIQTDIPFYIKLVELGLEK